MDRDHETEEEALARERYILDRLKNVLSTPEYTNKADHEDDIRPKTVPFSPDFNNKATRVEDTRSRIVLSAPDFTSKAARVEEDRPRTVLSFPEFADTAPHEDDIRPKIVRSTPDFTSKATRVEDTRSRIVLSAPDFTSKAARVEEDRQKTVLSFPEFAGTAPHEDDIRPKIVRSTPDFTSKATRVEDTRPRTVLSAPDFTSKAARVEEDRQKTVLSFPEFTSMAAYENDTRPRIVRATPNFNNNNNNKTSAHEEEGTRPRTVLSAPTFTNKAVHEEEIRPTDAAAKCGAHGRQPHHLYRPMSNGTLSTQTTPSRRDIIPQNYETRFPTVVTPTPLWPPARTGGVLYSPLCDAVVFSVWRHGAGPACVHELQQQGASLPLLPELVTRQHRGSWGKYNLHLLNPALSSKAPYSKTLGGVQSGRRAEKHPILDAANLAVPAQKIPKRTSLEEVLVKGRLHSPDGVNMKEPHERTPFYFCALNTMPEQDSFALNDAKKCNEKRNGVNLASA